MSWTNLKGIKLLGTKNLVILIKTKFPILIKVLERINLSRLFLRLKWIRQRIIRVVAVSVILKWPHNSHKLITKVLLIKASLKIQCQQIRVQVSVTLKWPQMLLKIRKVNNKINHSHHSLVSKWEGNLPNLNQIQVSQSHLLEVLKWDNRLKIIKRVSRKMNKREVLRSETSKWLVNQSLKTSSNRWTIMDWQLISSRIKVHQDLICLRAIVICQRASICSCKLTTKSLLIKLRRLIQLFWEL